MSFFGPFYGSYVVYELDKQAYQYSFIVGADNSYLWLLARTPEVSDDVKAHFLQSIKTLGVDPGELIWVDQSINLPPAKTTFNKNK